MMADPPSVHADVDQEHVAMQALAHGVGSVPVVDDQGRLLGIVPSTALIEILRHEHTEDLHKLAGIVHENHRIHEALEAAPTRRLWIRLPWLLVGLIGSVAATFVMTRFEAVLQQRVAIAFFIPAIVYLADAIGTQTEAIAVRFLSVTPSSLRGILLGELATGGLIGVSLAILIFPCVMLGFGDARLALAVALAVLGAGVCAAGIGLTLPWFLARAGKDPAFGSGPVATIIQDVLSLLIYFAIVVSLPV
jgi:magnesium transporter